MSGSNNAAGIVGCSYGDLTINNCHNTGNITNTVGKYAGGIIARDGNTYGVIGINITITNCSNTGTISGGNYFGGIMGAIGLNSSSLIIDNCNNTGELTVGKEGAVTVRAGGILGRIFVTYADTNATIVNSYNTEDITCEENGANNFEGGIIGWDELGNNTTIYNCYNLGNLSGRYAGGLIGRVYDAPIITNSYNAGTATGSRAQAGIVNFASGTSAPNITNTYYIDTNSAAFAGTITTATDAQAKSMTEAQMKARDFVVTLNNNITDASWNRWEQTDDSYPRFVKTPSIEFRTSPDHWTNINRDKVRVTIMETNGTGYTLQYSLDSGRTWTNYTSPITITQSPTIILARIYDTTKSHTLYLSTLTLGNDTSNGSGISDFQFTANATGKTITLSTVAKAGLKYQFQINGGAWVSGGTPTSYTFDNLTPETTYTVNMKAIASDGREKEASNTNKTVTTTKIQIADVSTVTEAMTQNAIAISPNNTSYAGTYKELTTTDGSVKIPVGFTIATDSASTVAGGIVVQDGNGNQYVWIPVDSSNTYERRAFHDQTVDATDSSIIKRTISGTEYSFTETMNSAEASATTNGGFYIGRYESGSVEDTAADTMRTAATEAKTVSIKANQVPYNYIAINSDKAAADTGNSTDLAAGMANANGYKTGIVTKLCSSYAWDTALNFIDKTVSNYSSNSPQGNYKDTSFSGGTDNAHKVLIKTGLTTAVCNIYDMGGNVWEQTSESSSHSTSPYSFRSGYFGTTSTGTPAGSREYGTGGAFASVGFRVTLYL